MVSSRPGASQTHPMALPAELPPNPPKGAGYWVRRTLPALKVLPSMSTMACLMLAGVVAL